MARNIDTYGGAPDGTPHAGLSEISSIQARLAELADVAKTYRRQLSWTPDTLTNKQRQYLTKTAQVDFDGATVYVPRRVR